jgi:mRNA interferase RelE/StbE
MEALISQEYANLNSTYYGYGRDTFQYLMCEVTYVEIQYAKAAIKTLLEMDRPTRQRMKQGIEEIPDGDIVALQGRENEFRVRIGKYRVIFEYAQKENEKVVHILDVGSRGDIL